MSSAIENAACVMAGQVKAGNNLVILGERWHVDSVRRFVPDYSGAPSYVEFLLSGDDQANDRLTRPTTSLVWVEEAN